MINGFTGESFFSRDKKLNSNVFAEFLAALLERYPYQEITLVVDNAPWYKSKSLASFLAANPRLSLFFVPPYSPELNPVENLWKWMKSKISRNKYYHKLHDLLEALFHFSEEIYENWELVLQKTGARRYLN